MIQPQTHSVTLESGGWFVSRYVVYQGHHVLKETCADRVPSKYQLYINELLTLPCCSDLINVASLSL